MTRNILLAVVLLLILIACAHEPVLEVRASKGGLHIRVNQVGYLATSSKRATLMSTEQNAGEAFNVVSGAGSVVFTGVVPEKSTKWNRRFPFVYQLDFSALDESGTYRIEVGGKTSPDFDIGGPELFKPLLADTMKFMRVQRDGPDVDPSLLDRQPSHLEDQTAKVYKKPRYSDFALVGKLHRVGGPVDVSGGWFDAGDYVKFLETTSFVEAMLLVAARDGATSSAAPELVAEGRFGIEWLDKMWDRESETLYYQVGIGDGNYDTILGDHDFWRLPEADDALNVKSGDPNYYVERRPVLRAGRPGTAVSPNLAGRLAASFALCSQVFKDTDQELADSCLTNAEAVYSLAETKNIDKLLSVSPHGYYPETEWRADMELGAVELYLATGSDHYLEQAARWAKRYIRHGEHDSLNLYDVGALAHYELAKAMRTSSLPIGLEINEIDLLDHLESQLSKAGHAAAKEPFNLGTYYGYDQASRSFGLATMALFYDELTNSPRFERLAIDQFDWALGDNPWGTSFMIGAGTRFPHCPHHQIANLSGSVDGTSPTLTGAVVGGPNHKTEFAFLGVPDEATKCPPAGAASDEDRFAGRGISYIDAVKMWPTNEPAIDFTIVATLLFQRLSGS